jgi:hypothetical protein
MRTLFTFCISVLTLTAYAQVPTNFGTNAEDGISYQTYNLIDHGVVSSVRFQAQNSIPEGQGTWEFFTGSYNPVWRPYLPDDTLSGFDAIIDPSLETASARFNTNPPGGATGLLPAIQAGYYYTAIIQDGTGDNFMSIIETDFAPVAIDTVYNTPTQVFEGESVAFTVELDGANALSPGEHVFVRWSTDGFATSNFTEISNFNAGVGQFSYPAGLLPVGTTFQYYALVTEEADPSALDDVDYYTLFFANNEGNNYEFTISALTGIEDVVEEYEILVRENSIEVRNTEDVQSIELVSVDGRVVAAVAANGSGAANISTTELSAGTYIINLISATDRASAKVFVQ